MMFKINYMAALALVATLGFTACSDDDDFGGSNPSKPQVTTGAYAVIQGNQFGGVPGCIDELDLKNHSVTTDAFQATNNQALGDSPQNGIRYGSKIYVPVFGSNLLWILDAQTLKIVAQVPTESPEAVCGEGKYVYVANNTGYVSRVDTLLFKIDEKKLEVGPNPAGLTSANGLIFVSISDGYNSANGYVNGKKVVAINPQTFDKAKEFSVGINPGQVETNSRGEIFVVCRGNYGDILPKIQKIDIQGNVSDYCEGSFIAMHKDTLYAVNLQADYVANTAKVSATRHLTLTGKSETFTFETDNEPGMPIALNINPTNGNLFVCSDQNPLGYDKSGFVYEYQNTGKLVNRYNVGIHPCGVIFK